MKIEFNESWVLQTNILRAPHFGLKVLQLMFVKNLKLFKDLRISRHSQQWKI